LATIKSFEELIIWQEARKFANDIYKLTKKFPKEEMYGLTSQLRRSAVSIPSNIAEGFTRFHNKEYRQFLYISLGSCAELNTQIIISSHLSYLSSEKAERILNEIDEISKMIYEYMLVVDDGKWVTDPNAKVYADDGFGSKNAVLFINNNG